VEPGTKPLDVLTIGEMVVDFISDEKTDTLSNASTFRRYLGGSPANIAVYVSKLGGESAIIAKTGIGAFGKFLKSELQRHGVTTEYLSMDHRTHTTVIFVSSTSATPDFEEFRSGDYLLRPEEVSEEAIARTRVIHASAFALSRDPQRLAVRRAMRLGSRLFDFNMDEETLEETALTEFHDLGADIVILTRSGGFVTISDNGSVEHVGPLPKVQIENVTGARDAFWSALLVAHLDGKSWSEAVRFAHEVASLKLRVEGHVERMIDREAIYTRLRTTARQPS
jgi:sugar/nucleoside kinase (ribokinase family)